MNKKFFEELSEVTGIPLEDFTKALGYRADSEVGFVRDVARARKVFKTIEAGSEAETLLLERWISLCRTPKEAKEVYERTEEGSLARSKAKDRWNRLSLARLNMATTSAEAKHVYRTSLIGGVAWRLAAEKCAKLCRTLRQARRLWLSCEPEDDMLEALALDRMLELCTSIDKAKELYHKSPPHCEISRLALLKMIKIYRNRR